MADATSAGATPLLPGLLDDIVICEILVRLPPKAHLRCRAVSRAWRRTTSTRDFLLAHHARQPALLITSGHDYGGRLHDRDLITYDHRARAAGAQLQRVAQLDERDCGLVACCDGLLLVSRNIYREDACSSVYNPATRQCAPIPALCDSKVSCNHILGMYRHRPTGEYRILMYGKNKETDYHEEEICFYDDACYIFALGSVQPLRNIGCPPVEQLLLHREATTAVMFRGNLHWHIDQNETESNMIVVFDTPAESFRQMHAPVFPVFRNVPAYADLFDMDGVLGMLSCDEAADTIDIWVLPDYESEVWTFKCKIEVPVIEIKALCGQYDDCWYAVVMHVDGELLVLVQYAEWLLQIDMDGKFVATFHRHSLSLTKLQLKQTLVPHTFFLTLE
ncbi:hypothetical protein ACQJBY_029756 [Aegilops geniculata]